MQFPVKKILACALLADGVGLVVAVLVGYAFFR